MKIVIIIIAMYIRQNVSYLRRKQKLTQTELGEMIGKTAGAIGGYEKGVSLPPIEIIIQLCKIFQVNIDEFVNKDLAVDSAQSTPVQDAQEKYDTKDSKLLMQLMKDKLVEVSKVMKKENPDKYDDLNLDKLVDLIGEE
jgi:transcriptional regulator with XRE-family HTH domain